MAPLGNTMQETKLEYRLPFCTAQNDKPVCATREISMFSALAIPHVHKCYCEIGIVYFLIETDANKDMAGQALAGKADECL